MDPPAKRRFVKTGAAVTVFVSKAHVHVSKDGTERHATNKLITDMGCAATNAPTTAPSNVVPPSFQMPTRPWVWGRSVLLVAVKNVLLIVCVVSSRLQRITRLVSVIRQNVRC